MNVCTPIKHWYQSYRTLLKVCHKREFSVLCVRICFEAFPFEHPLPSSRVFLPLSTNFEISICKCIVLVTAAMKLSPLATPQRLLHQCIDSVFNLITLHISQLGYKRALYILEPFLSQLPRELQNLLIKVVFIWQISVAFQTCFANKSYLTFKKFRNNLQIQPK